MPDCDSEPAEWYKKELGLAIGGATLFIIVSKVSLLLNLLHKKRWYTDLMTFLVSLSMGTMYCITLVQFIPEAFGELPFQFLPDNLDPDISNRHHGKTLQNSFQDCIVNTNTRRKIPVLFQRYSKRCRLF